jgi:hypothetical protein
VNPPSTVPTGIQYYVPVVITNTQTTATPNPFQQMIQVNTSKYSAYMKYNNSFANFEFFYANGTIIPAWIESYSAPILTIWLKLKSIPASSSLTIYLGFASKSTNLLSSSGTSGIGEAPQLSPTYAQYDDGASVFIYYNVNPTSTTGWTMSGTVGRTSSAPSGSHYSTTNAYYAYSTSGSYLYTAISGLSTNEIISFNVYTTGLGNLFFLTSSSGAGQMARLDSRSGSYSGLATTSSWTSWNTPSGIQESANTWYKYDIVISGTSAYAYIGPVSNSLATLGTATSSSAFSITNNGNYLGLVGDNYGSSYITYWNGFIVRAYPPNGVMPSVSFPTNLTNYQVLVTLDTASLISAGKMRSDCGDIRFTDSDAQTLLSYWIESGCNSATTKIWVKVPTIPASSTKTIYVYYGNPSATNQSSGDNTFDYFDTGNKSTTWTQGPYACEQTTAVGDPIPSYKCYSSKGYYMYKNINLAAGAIITFNVVTNGLGNFYFLTDSNGAGQMYRIDTRANNPGGFATTTSWTSWTSPSSGFVFSSFVYYKFTIILSGNSAILYYNQTANASPTGFGTLLGTYTITNKGGYIGLVGDDLGSTYATAWDNIIVRKYTTPGPTTSVGAEQSV